MGTAAIPVAITTPRIKLGEFLKWAGVAATGGAAKTMVQQGKVKVNGDIERRRGRGLRPGDLVTIAGQEYRVASR
jgi:ribosome-associated protein